MSHDDNVEAILGCILSTMEPRVPSQQRWCAHCGRGVWVSNAAVENLEGGAYESFKYLCLPCLAADDAYDVTTVPAWQRDELHESGLDDETIDRFTRVANDALREHKEGGG